MHPAGVMLAGHRQFLFFRFASLRVEALDIQSAINLQLMKDERSAFQQQQAPHQLIY
jgi:hypothetical protein